MPVYLVERNFAEKIKLSDDSINQINDVTGQLGAEWLSTFLSADGKKTYCLYEASDPELLQKHAKVIGIPADEIVEVNRMWPLGEK